MMMNAYELKKLWGVCVTQPLDNAALASLAKSSQLIGQAVQEDRWRDMTSQAK